MSPVELVKKYNDENYDIISITDHDNIKAFQEAKIAGEALNITVVPGVELSTEHTLTLEADADAQHPGRKRGIGGTAFTRLSIRPAE